MLPENKFDELLKSSLKQHKQFVPFDFQYRTLDKIQNFEQQKAIKKVIWQERLLKACFISLPMIAVVVIVSFPNLLTASSRLLETLYILCRQAVVGIVRQWQLSLIYIIAAAAAIYAFYETLISEN